MDNQQVETLKTLIATNLRSGKSPDDIAIRLYELGFRDCSRAEVYVVHCKERDTTTMSDDFWVKGVYLDPEKAEEMFNKLSESDSIFKDAQVDPVALTI